MKALLASMLCLIGPALAGAAPEPAPAAFEVKPGIVDGATAKALVAAGAKVLDVRTPDEYGVGHVPGAINIPYDELPRRAREIGPASTAVVVYCMSGHRSGIAVDALRKAGYSRVYDMKYVSAWPGSLAK